MMARIGYLICFSLRRRSRPRSSTALAVSLMLGLSLGLSAPNRSDAAKLSSFLTAKDLARPLLLDQNGQQLQLPSSHHTREAFPQGSTPTYLAIPLSGGEHLPAGTITIFSGQGGSAEGPLDFNSLIKSKVDAALSTSGLVAVDTPERNYVVEFLPRSSHSQLDSNTGVASTPPAQAGNTGSSATPATASAPTTSKATTSSPTTELSQFLGGTLSVSQLTKNGIAEVENLLGFNSSKPTVTKPSLNLEAQVIEPPLPAPIPEPGTWLIFGLIIAAVGLRSIVGRPARVRPSPSRFPLTR